MPTKTRPCQSHHPETCPYHRNGVLAEKASRTAMLSLDTNNRGAYLTNMDKARQYRELQARVELGDTNALDETRAAIAAEHPQGSLAANIRQKKSSDKSSTLDKPNKSNKSNKSTYPPKSFSRNELSLSAGHWRAVQDRVAKSGNGVKLNYDSTTVDAMGNVTVHGLKVDGEHNDVNWAENMIRAYESKEAGRIADAEAGLRQKRPSTMNRALLNGVEADDRSAAKRGFDPNSMSPRDQRERLGLPADAFDTPTEHVATIPSFDDFKRMFGFGKKK